MASRRWLIGIVAASFRRSIYLNLPGANVLASRSVVLVALLGAALPAVTRAQATAPTTPKITGYVQGRFQAIGDSAVFLLRRVRLGVQGNITPWASYKVQGELRSGGTAATAATVAATDLYLALTHRRWIATIGQSKTPLSAKFIRSSAALELPERSMAVDSLAPNRDVGVKLEWNTAGAVALQSGVFNGDGINRAANRDKRFLYMGRTVVRAAKGVYAGVSVAAKPDTTTWDAEAWLERGRVAMRGEFLARRRSSAAVTTLGWYALGAYAAVPKRVQLVGRAQQFDPDDRVGADGITGYTGAAQYFLSGDDLKLQLEYTVFDEQGPAVSNNRVIVQMQARW
jgi:phosphate-selective porin O/P